MGRPRGVRTPFPISDVREAVAWLWAHSDVEDWLRAGPLPLEARLVCDVFWVGPAQLRSYMSRFWGAS